MQTTLKNALQSWAAGPGVSSLGPHLVRLLHCPHQHCPYRRGPEGVQRLLRTTEHHENSPFTVCV